MRCLDFVKNTRFINDIKFEFDETINIFDTPKECFEEIDDFEIVINKNITKSKKKATPTVLYYSKSKGILVPYHFLEFIVRDAINLGKIPFGPLNDVDQGWRIYIYSNNYMVFILLGNTNNEVFETRFMVKKDLYTNEWTELIEYFKS